MKSRWIKHLAVEKPLAPPVLGQREIQTLDFFWSQQQGQLSALDVKRLIDSRTFGSDDAISISTIQSTMERLWRKGLLSRKKEGKAFIYCACYSKQEVISSLLSEIKNEMGQGDELVMMSGIVEYLQSWDSALSAKIVAVFNEHTAAVKK